MPLVFKPGKKVYKLPELSVAGTHVSMLGLDYGSWRYALNASKLFAKEYVATCIAHDGCWLEAKRQVIASATYYW